MGRLRAVLEAAVLEALVAVRLKLRPRDLVRRTPVVVVERAVRTLTVVLLEDLVAGVDLASSS
ncbi:MAG: hypothetical protein EBZ13_06290 [Planctomycetia bacterium]|nr:hypothetical protein [Planctomycetia bacterium]